jgi:alkylated DNA repair dioxygenase AlkB
MSSTSVNKKNMQTSCITITYGDCAENHIGMQILGQKASEGFSLDDLKRASKAFKRLGCERAIWDLTTGIEGDAKDINEIGDEKAYILIVKGGASALLEDSNVDDLYKEQLALDWDKKAKMKGRVVNKHARYNLCYDDEEQEPDYEEGKGRVVSYRDVPLLAKIKNRLPDMIGSKAKDLKAEGNYYYDTSKCYIKPHGDAERRKVIAIRLGASMELHFQWYHRFRPVSTLITFTLSHGDLYVMSSKATGTDWKKSSIYTLRHSAGDMKLMK